MENSSPKWYVDMTTRFNQLAQNFGLEGPAADDLRSFMIEIAKEQYKVGNKCGIRWARSDDGKAYFAARA
ncbi:MAG: hypothetical protein ABIG32_01240 [Candidatus Uhrbacteria bacterium]|nr:hypothetical protein [Patescibacteria group bacterium]MBU1907419.1 hypothetical protein [Patescibacteria group bacterium]